MKSLTQKTKIWDNNVVTRRFGKYSFQVIDSMSHLDFSLFRYLYSIFVKVSKQWQRNKRSYVGWISWNCHDCRHYSLFSPVLGSSYSCLALWCSFMLCCYMTMLFLTSFHVFLWIQNWSTIHEMLFLEFS